MLGQVQSTQGIQDAVRQYGAAPGGQKLMEKEHDAAQLAIQTGLYVTWRSRKTNEDCCRVGPSHKCFCGHLFSAHHSKGKSLPKCSQCACRLFDYVPNRPEEVGEWWLPRRKGFNMHSWRAKCKCGTPHDQHDPITRAGPCATFVSNYLCVVCESHQEDHDTMYESASDRTRDGRAVGKDFLPLAETPDLQQLVLGGGGGSSKGQRGKPKAVKALPDSTPEDLLSCGQITTQEYYQMIQSESSNEVCPPVQEVVGSRESGSGVGSRMSGSAVGSRVSGSGVGSRVSRSGGERGSVRPVNTTGREVEKSVRLMHHSSGGVSEGRVVNAYGLTESNLRANGTKRAQARWLGDGTIEAAKK